MRLEELVQAANFGTAECPISHVEKRVKTADMFSFFLCGINWVDQLLLWAVESTQNSGETACTGRQPSPRNA